MMHGDCRLSKASPIKSFKGFLVQYSTTHKHKWVVLDGGGELYGNPKVKGLFKSFDYKIYITGPDASFQNGVNKDICINGNVHSDILTCFLLAK